jgi:hypothetical protein
LERIISIETVEQFGRAAMKPKVVIFIGVVLVGFGIVVSAMMNMELARIDEIIFYYEHSYETPQPEHESLLEERNMLQNALVPLFGMVIVVGLTLIVVGAIVSVKSSDKTIPPQ